MQIFNLDISQKGIPPVLIVKQVDVGRKFKVILTDGGTAYTAPEGAVFSVWYEGSSGSGNYSTIEDRPAVVVDGNVAMVEVVAQMVTNAGGGNLCLVLNAVDGSQIGLWNIVYIVEAVPGMGSKAAEQYYTAFSQSASSLAHSAETISQAQERIDSLIKAKNATAAGLIYPLASVNIPSGFLLCDGKEYSRTEYEELFAAIGTVYGEGDGSTTFNVPNLSTRVPVGAGGDYEIGDVGGEAEHKLTVDELPKHSHNIQTRYSKLVSSESIQGGVASYHNQDWWETEYAQTETGGGGDQPHNIMQPYTVVNYIISTGKEVEFVVGGTGIDDNVTSPTTTWSSEKIDNEIKKTALIVRITTETMTASSNALQIVAHTPKGSIFAQTFDTSLAYSGARIYTGEDNADHIEAVFRSPTDSSGNCVEYTIDENGNVKMKEVNPVLYSEQDLTADQQSQARKNIGAATIDDTKAGADAWSSQNIVDRLCPAFTESGAAVTCSPVEGYPLEVVTQIDPIQTGEGTPYPPGGGKNLFNMDTTYHGINNGTAVFSDGKLTVTGHMVNAKKIPIKPSTTYTISYKSTRTGEKGGGIHVRYEDSAGTFADATYSRSNVLNGSFSFTTVANAVEIVISFYGSNDGTDGVNYAVFTEVQLEIGSTATAYAPYSNIRPITGSTTAKLTRCGKNILDTKNPKIYHNNPYTPQKQYTLTDTGFRAEFLTDAPDDTGRFYYFLGTAKELAGKTLTISGEFYSSVKGQHTISLPFISFYCTNVEPCSNNANIVFGNGGYLGASGSRESLANSQNARSLTYTVTGEEPMRYIVAGFQHSRGAGVVGDWGEWSNIQVEIGNAATQYEPYRGQTFAVQLGQTVYGGSYDWQTGELTVDRVVRTVDGTEQWYSSSNNNNDGVPRYDCDVATTFVSGTGITICINSHYPSVAVNHPGAWVNKTSSTKQGLRIKWQYETVDELKAYLAEQYAAGTPVQLCYELATPITIQLTPQEILALSGENTLYSDTGDTAVTGRADPQTIIADQQATIKSILERVTALESAAINNT